MSKTLSVIINGLLLFLLFTASAVTILSGKKRVAALIIYLDPGHGGMDGGAVAADGTMEKDIVLNVCYHVRTYLENAGFGVIMTRSGDYDLAPLGSKNKKRDDIYKRCDLINNSDCTLYLSIHANKFFDSRVYGAQVFFRKNDVEGKRLAECIQSMIRETLLNTKRAAKSIAGKYLIDHVIKTGCLVEIGFLSNGTELELLKDSAYQEKMALAIFSGVISFLGYEEKT